MTGLFLLGVTSLVESSAVGALSATAAALLKRRLGRAVMEETLCKTLGVSCMFMWIILAALCFGAVSDGSGVVRVLEFLFLENLGLGPWQVLVLMHTFLGEVAWRRSASPSGACLGACAAENIVAAQRAHTLPETTFSA